VVLQRIVHDRGVLQEIAVPVFDEERGKFLVPFKMLGMK
jgi:hypothetical protein